jgi:hypothetical protein
MRHRRPSEARVPARNFVHRSLFVRVGLEGERALRLGLHGGATAAHSDGMASRAQDGGGGRAYVRQGAASQLLWRKV